MSGVRAVVSLSVALAGLAACQKSSLQGDPPPGGIQPAGGGGSSNTGTAGTTGAFAGGGGFAGVAAPAGVGGSIGVGGSVGLGGASGSGPPPVDFGASPCVITSVPLPWTTVTGLVTRLEVVTSSDAIAVLNRQPGQLDIRTYRRDGTPLGGLQFAPDVQLLPNGSDHFLLIARGTTGDFVATDLPPSLLGGRRAFVAASTATEQVRAAVPLAATIILLTTERFLNMANGAYVPWTAVLGPEAQTLASGRVYGATSVGSEMLVAGGSGRSLGLMVLDSAGNVIRSGVDGLAFDSLASADAMTTLPFGGGLLMFDGNPTRLTQIGFDLSRTELGHNTQMATFYATAPRIAPIVVMGRPVGVWLTVFPGADNSQGTTVHQLYACALDVAAPAACATTLPIAQTGLSGYDIAPAPIGVVALADGRAFAVAHSDAAGHTWLRVTDMMCGPRAGPN